MKLWLISQDVNNEYDTFDSAVVAADTEEDAQDMHPASYIATTVRETDRFDLHTWAAFEDIYVTLLGSARPGTKKGVICSSFNAG